MPILVMTVREQAVLSSIIDIHRDGLMASKEAMLDDLEDNPAVRQEMMAAIKREESVIGKVDFPNVMTRQQIRHAERKNRDAPAEITMYGHRYQRID